MFQIGDYIIYGSTGVCQVEEIGVPENFSGADPSRTYYTLNPVYDVGYIYIPVDTTMFMRAVVNKEEARALVDGLAALEVEVFDSRNMKLLSDHYLATIQSHDCAQLLRLIKTVNTKARTAAANGKRPGQTDLRFLKRAEDLLYGEFSVALDMPIADVPSYIEAAMFSECAE